MRKITSKSLLRGLTVFIVTTLWLLVNPVNAFFWTLFLIWAVFKLDSRIIGLGAIIILIIIPIALSIETYTAKAEQLAVYVYYLLVITIALQILKLRREHNLDEETETTK